MKKSLATFVLVAAGGVAAYTAHGYGFFGLGQMQADGTGRTGSSAVKPGKTMRAFKSDAELKEYFEKFQREATERRASGNGALAMDGVSSNSAAAQPASPAAKSEPKAGADKD